MSKQNLPPSLRDGQYRNWEVEMAARYPRALSEMLMPSTPLDALGTKALARWGIEIQRDRFRIIQIKEKMGRLTVYLATEGTPEMTAAIHEAFEESAKVCEMCSAPRQLEGRGPTGWWSTRCPAHETWTPNQELL